MLRTHLRSEIQIYFLKSVIFFSVFLFFSLHQTTSTITSEELFQLDDPRTTQLLATQCDCSKRHNVTQFSSICVQKVTQASHEIESPRTFASVFVRAKTDQNEAFRCSSIIPKLVSFMFKLHITTTMDVLV